MNEIHYQLLKQVEFVFLDVEKSIYCVHEAPQKTALSGSSVK